MWHVSYQSYALQDFTKPSCLQATTASGEPQLLSETTLHTPWWVHSSMFPSYSVFPPHRRMSPLLQASNGD